MSQKFEFTAEHNKQFLELHKWLKAFAIIFILANLLIIIAGIRQVMGPRGMVAWYVVLLGILRFTFGILLLRPLDNIKNLVETEGNDIPQLMISFQDFSQAFYLGIIIAIAQIASLGWRFINFFTSG